MKKPYTILYSGGGTLGPVTPLLAIHEMATEALSDSYTAHWIGTRGGVEQTLVREYHIPYHTITAGKLRRYFSLWNITDIFKIAFGTLQAAWLLAKINPSVCVTAGGFVSVPVHYAAWLLGIPTWVHQQDVQVGLANRLMKPLATQITTVLSDQIKFFPARKTTWLGNPIRQDIVAGSAAEGKKIFKLQSNLPVILVTGGGTGSQRINQLIVESLPHLKGICQIIHLTGKERPQEMVSRAAEIFSDYYQTHQFLGAELKDAYAVADLIIARGGFGTLTEVAALSKPLIVIPKPGHQVENVRYFAAQKALYLVEEAEIDSNYLAQMIKQLLSQPENLAAHAKKLRELLPPATPETVVGLIKSLVKSS